MALGVATVVLLGTRAAPRFVRFPAGAGSHCDTDAVEPCALAGEWRC